MSAQPHHQVSLASVIKSFRQTSNCAMPALAVSFSTPGGYGDLGEGIDFLSALRLLSSEKCHVSSVNFVLELQKELTMVAAPLGCHSPDWDASGYRFDKEVYYYPRCPKDYPLEKLHHLAFMGNASKIAEYDAALAQYGSWFVMSQSTLIPEEDMDAMFTKVTSETHGTNADFVRAWLEMQRKSWKKDGEKRVLIVNPVEYGLRCHDIIIHHMPFVRANRKLARLLLSHSLVIAGYFPPIFDSSVSYEYKITRHRFCDLLNIRNAPSDEIRQALQEKLNDEFLGFASFVLSCCETGEMASYGTPIQTDRPRDLWEVMAKDATHGAIVGFLGPRGRTKITDILTAFAPFIDVDGKATLKLGDGRWIWSGMSDLMVNALGELIKAGAIEVLDAEVSEYSHRFTPKFDATNTRETWAPSVFMAVDMSRKKNSQ